MGHLENKFEWCIKKAEKEGEKHRGLKKIEADIEKANKHVLKAEHNLQVMIYLINGKYYDWAISTCFYARYHCLLALLAKHEYESRNQECTITAIEYLIKNKKINLDIIWIKKIAIFDDKTDEGIIKLREEFQYGTETAVDENKINALLDETKEFIDMVKDMI